MKALVAGATGVIGRQLLPLLREGGIDAIAIVRSRESANWLSDQSYPFVQCDVLDHTALTRAFESAKPDVVINELTAIPENLNPRRIRSELAMTNTLRDYGTRLLMSAASGVGARRFISQSIAFAYEPLNRSAADESQPLYDAAPSGFDAAVAAIRACEKTTPETPGMEGVVLR